MRKMSLVLVALAGLGLASESAMAFPSAGATEMVGPTQTAKVDQVRYVCGPYRCFWRPNYGYYGYRPYYRPYRPYYRPYGFYGRRRYGFY